MTKAEHAHLEFAAGSHPGMLGKINEDRYSVSAFLTGLKGDVPAVLAVLCDGIGGHRAGEVAAQMGVSVISEMVSASDGEQPIKILDQAIQRANHAIYEASLSDQGRKGMGTTVACAWVIADRLYTANLGDSRIYLLRGGHILQLTTDHTWLQEAYDAGIINEDQADSHPNAHVIRRYLGSAKAPRPDFRLWFFEGEGDAEALDNQGLNLEPGDILLVCSDGLTDLVTDQEIHGIIRSTPMEQTPAALIDLANTRGGHDNSTVVLMQVPSKSVRTSKPPLKRRWLIGCLVFLVFLGLLAATVFLGMWGRLGRPAGLATHPPTPTQLDPTQTPAAAQFTVTATHTATFTATPDSDDFLTTPQPTLTPWPTHTLSP
jgi:PPM family protein phosphatase